jgi:large subunit ribosomal protein L19
MNVAMLKKIEKKYSKKRPEVKIGDTVRLHMKIQEGNKERVQVFEGMVIAMRGVGVNQNIVVRKISYGVGVEKIVPLYLPTLKKIEVIKRGKVRRSKLYYIRDRVGKRAMKISDMENLYLTDEEEQTVQEEEESPEVAQEVTEKEEENKKSKGE